ncbi:MAG: hypothetical protein ACFFBD_19800, partial [Candidatus Hodarchaeota archaeon]
MCDTICEAIRDFAMCTLHLHKVARMLTSNMVRYTQPTGTRKVPTATNEIKHISKRINNNYNLNSL